MTFFLTVPLCQALPLTSPIKASTFLTYPLEAITLKKPNSDQFTKWQTDYGYLNGIATANEISWTSTMREGVYPVKLANDTGRIDTAYILVRDPNSLVSREEFAYLLALFLPARTAVIDDPEIKKDLWSLPALRTCVAYGIFSYQPGDPLTP
ncbi:MAG: hypothetical protein WC838_06890, partial [Candidatus Margulisiibacteriota bacterium]